MKMIQLGISVPETTKRQILDMAARMGTIPVTITSEWGTKKVQRRVTQCDVLVRALALLERELSPVAAAEIEPVDDQDELTDDAPAELRI